MITTMTGEKIHHKQQQLIQCFGVNHQIPVKEATVFKAGEFIVPTTFHFKDLSAIESIHLLRMLLVFSILF